MFSCFPPQQLPGDAVEARSDLIEVANEKPALASGYTVVRADVDNLREQANHLRLDKLHARPILKTTPGTGLVVLYYRSACAFCGHAIQRIMGVYGYHHACHVPAPTSRKGVACVK